MSQYKHRINLKFEKPEVEGEPICSQMKIAQVFDDFCLKASELTIDYTRSKWQKSLEEAFNPTRYTRLMELWLIYYSVYGALPVVTEAYFSSKNGTTAIEPSELDLPTSPLSLESEPFLTTNTARSILASENRDSLLFSLSYFITSKQAGIDEMSRFRFLWSAFNPLYNIYTPNDKERSEATRARNLMCELDKLGMLNKAQQEFSSAPSAGSDGSKYTWRFGDFLKNYAPNEKDPAKFKHPAVITATAEDSDKETLSAIARYGYLWTDIPDENNPIVLKLKSNDPDDGSLFKFAMYEYLYWLRCDTMHGNSPYPIFMSHERRDLLNTLSNCLDIAVIKGIELCSELHPKID